MEEFGVFGLGMMQIGKVLGLIGTTRTRPGEAKVHINIDVRPTTANGRRIRGGMRLNSGRELVRGGNQGIIEAMVGELEDALKKMPPHPMAPILLNMKE